MISKFVGNFLSLFRSMYQMVHVSKSNCLPICSHCEVAVSERTAKAISDLIDSRIKEYAHKTTLNSSLIDEMRLIQKMIKDGNWHDNYDVLTDREN